jgi:hypothetical protein
MVDKIDNQEKGKSASKLPKLKRASKPNKESRSNKASKFTKISKPSKVSKPSHGLVWNGHFTVASCSLVLLMVGLAVIWEGVDYRQTRKESMKMLMEWGREGQSYSKANLSASKKNEFRESLKVAIGHLRQYRRDPEKNHNALVLSRAQLKIVLEQMGETSKKSSIGKNVLRKLKEVEALIAKNQPISSSVIGGEEK